MKKVAIVLVVFLASCRGLRKDLPKEINDVELESMQMMVEGEEAPGLGVYVNYEDAREIRSALRELKNKDCVEKED